MSEKEKEIEEAAAEENVIDHWSHQEHPLTLLEISHSISRGDLPRRCYGCRRYFGRGERAYGCSSKKSCGYRRLFHEECAGMPRKIRHPLHPQHILIQQHAPQDLWWRCAICEGYIWDIGYGCTSLGCKFEMHMGCAQGGGVMMDAADDDDVGAIRHHPSHPKHELKLLRRCSLKCDACGTTRREYSYTCTSTACQYSIHESCATLPQTMEREDHHHPLSLSFHVPLRYLKFDYRCEVCNKYLLPKYWIYHCELCSYAVHLKCAFNTTTANAANASNQKDIIQLPTNDVAEELIRPFVTRHGGGGGAIAAPNISHDDNDEDDDGMVNNNVKYKFLLHEHQLTLISSSSHHHENKDEEEEDDYDYGKRSELLCDGCITPIFSSSSSSSSSSSDDKYYYYMSCGECKYNLHMACFHLPPHLIPSLPPLLHRPGHDLLLLQSCDRLKPWDFRKYRCRVCGYFTNGLSYACKKCDFRADIKCASLPDTIYHAAHPQHPLKLLLRGKDIPLWLQCAAACRYGSSAYCYVCERCDFMVHVGCAVLPASMRSRRWDEQHPLLLTYNANLNHPADFYCDHCETQMNPKSWMYHCRPCDLSFHPDCFPATSGWCRNLKLGGQQQYYAKNLHPHPLTFQLLTTKRRCDLCRWDMLEQPGFHCAPCNFFICFNYCGKEMVGKGGGEIEAMELNEENHMIPS